MIDFVREDHAVGVVHLFTVIQIAASFSLKCWKRLNAEL